MTEEQADVEPLVVARVHRVYTAHLGLSSSPLSRFPLLVRLVPREVREEVLIEKTQGDVGIAVRVVNSGGGIEGEKHSQGRLAGAMQSSRCLALTVVDYLPAGLVKGKMQHGRKALPGGKSEDAPSCLARAQVTRFDEIGYLVRSSLWLRDRSQSSSIALEGVLVKVLDGSYGRADLDVDVLVVSEGESWAVRDDPPVVHPPTAQKHIPWAYLVSLGGTVTELNVHRSLVRLRGLPSAVNGVPVLRKNCLGLKVLRVSLGAHAIPLALAAAGSVHHDRSNPVKQARLAVGVEEFRRHVPVIVLGLGLVVGNHNDEDMGVGKTALLELATAQTKGNRQ